MSRELPGLLVCQETLAPLTVVDGGLWSDAAQRLYPVADRLVYMGFPVRDATMISATMEEEREWQGTASTVDRDAEFLRESVPQTITFINLVKRYVPREGARVLELGSGSGWVSWLFAQAGYEVYLCDFEANSLVLGLHFQHPRMGIGHRIVADARYAPFPSGVFDVVVFKQFVHHVDEDRALLREASRVLKPGGIVALMEPTMSVAKRVWAVRNPDPHEGHHITWPGHYLRSLRSLGFESLHLTALYDQRVPRRRPVRFLKQRAAQRTAAGRRADLFVKAHLRILGGAQLVVIARKTREVQHVERPPMTVIDPSTMTVDEASRESHGVLVPIVAEALTEIDPRNAAP